MPSHGAAIQERLRHLLDHFSQAELARRTGYEPYQVNRLNKMAGKYLEQFGYRGTDGTFNNKLRSFPPPGVLLPDF